MTNASKYDVSIDRALQVAEGAMEMARAQVTREDIMAAAATIPPHPKGKGVEWVIELVREAQMDLVNLGQLDAVTL